MSAELLSWHRHPSSVCKLKDFRKLLHVSRPNFVGSSLSTIPRNHFFFFFQNFEFSNFYEFFSFPLTWDPMGAKISKKHYTTPPVFIRSEPNIMINEVVMREYKVMVYIGNLPKFINFMALWKFNMGVNGKIAKCATSWKQMNVEQNGWKFGTPGTTVHICKVLLMPDSFSLVWDHLVHFEKFPILQFLKICSASNFHLSKLYTRYHNHTGCHSFGDLPKIEKKLWHFEIFLNTGLYAAEMFKVLFFPTIFIGVHPHFITTLVTMVNWNAC